MSDSAHEGGCFCGMIRYQVTEPFTNLTHCHCRDCQRASGSPFVTWVTVERQKLRFLRGTPARLEYEDRLRTFCPRCSTPLTFEETGIGEVIDVTVCSLDQPADLRPGDHTWVEDQLPWIKLADGLPVHGRQRSPG